MGSNTDKSQDKIPSGTLGKAKVALLCQSYTQASVWDMRGKWECDSHKDLGCPRVGVVSTSDLTDRPRKVSLDPGSIQGLLGWGLEKIGIMEVVPEHGKGGIGVNLQVPFNPNHDSLNPEC
ncbi:hypothetical protein TURU_148713 [Turdus rufiventris]|nr:hypothetical protein TURU_148713 [Turdus rufiventris]